MVKESAAGPSSPLVEASGLSDDLCDSDLRDSCCEVIVIFNQFVY
jgi:hypothetical protein